MKCIANNGWETPCAWIGCHQILEQEKLRCVRFTRFYPTCFGRNFETSCLQISWRCSVLAWSAEKPRWYMDCECDVYQGNTSSRINSIGDLFFILVLNMEVNRLNSQVDTFNIHWGPTLCSQFSQFNQFNQFRVFFPWGFFSPSMPRGDWIEL